MSHSLSGPRCWGLLSSTVGEEEGLGVNREGGGWRESCLPARSGCRMMALKMLPGYQQLCKGGVVVTLFFN